ncbi:MAG: hypothetical protein M4579_000030 [Chaenotheca gracillima]|nr:MAG: hypothetical protein M4579_000030 [Chaenotheca gracillima]
MALRALILLLESGSSDIMFSFEGLKGAPENSNWPFLNAAHHDRLYRVLTDLLMNPFEDVREAAAKVFQQLFVGCRDQQEDSENPDNQQFLTAGACVTKEALCRRSSPYNYNTMMNRADDLMRTSGRADHSNGVARSQDILFGFLKCEAPKRYDGKRVETLGSFQLSLVHAIVSRLERDIRIAEKSLLQGISNPVHGHLESLRAIFDRADFYTSRPEDLPSQRGLWSKAHQGIISASERIWVLVKPILCDESPEGFELEEQADLGTKDVLSYCWRALKESSSLLRCIASKTPFDPRKEVSILSRDDVKKIGNLSFRELADLRHRGAFSTVSQTFAACCQRCSTSQDQELSQLPEQWYKCIHDQASETTRRSAGIPSLMTGILSSQSHSPLFQRALLDLTEIAEAPLSDTSSNDGSELSQVHALNCLKDVFTSNRLARASEAHVAGALDIAAQCLNSPAWPIRNCGVMLFRALADRLLGSNFSQNSDRPNGERSDYAFSYNKYPKLPGLLKSLLEGESRNSSYGVSAQMTFPALEILYRAGPPDIHYNSMKRSVLRHSASSVWQIRQMAAHAYCAFLREGDYIQEVESLLDLSQSSVNRKHGRLLTVKVIAERLSDCSSVIAATAIGILNKFLRSSLVRGEKINLASLAELKSFSEDSLRIGYPESEINASPVPTIRAQSAPCDTLLDATLKLAAVENLCIQYLIDEDFEAMEHLLTYLAKFDTDTANSGLDTLSSLMTEASERVIHLLPRIISIYLELACLGQSCRVETKLKDGLAILMEIWVLQTHFIPLDPKIPDLVSKFVASVQWPQTTGVQCPSAKEADLHLRGAIMACACTHEGLDSDVIRTKLKMWDCMLQEAGRDTQTKVAEAISTRLAAVSALKAFERVFRFPNENPTCHGSLLPLYLTLYDSLNDDDDEVRDISASVVSWIFSDPSKGGATVSLIPIAASQMLSAWLGTTYAGSNIFIVHVISRLTAAGSRQNWSETPVSDLLADARKEDSALFVEEKQNLYLDQASEADIWGEVLSVFQIDDIPDHIQAALEEWTGLGLQALTSVALAEIDGPLGWTSKPDCFALGVNVITCAKVLIGWERRGQSSKLEKVKMSLEALRNIGSSRSLHELWLDRIDEALQK